MQDSLDFNALKASIRTERRTRLRNTLIYGSITFVILMLGVLVIASPTDGLCGCEDNILTGIAGLFCVCIAPVALGGLLISVYSREGAKADNNSPSLLPKSTRHKWERGSILSICWVALWGILGIFFHVDQTLVMSMMAAPLVAFVVVSLWVRSALMRGQYDEVIRRAEINRRWLISNIYSLNIEGMAHLLAGHAVESENTNRLLISQSYRNKIYWALGLNNYACELIYQGRYDDALPLLETAIKARPESPMGYDTLANWYLAQNIAPKRALEIAEYGIKLPNTWSTGSKSASMAVRMATYAWAEARNGLGDKARLMLKQALSKADRKNVPYFSELNRIAGETYLALNDIPLARQHFAKAAEVDPNGRIGKMARERLQTLLPEPDTPPVT